MKKGMKMDQTELVMTVAAIIAVTAATIMVMAYCAMISATPLHQEQRQQRQKQRQEETLSNCAVIYRLQQYLTDDNAPRRIPWQKIFADAGNDVKVIHHYESSGENEGFGYSPRRAIAAQRLYKKSLRTAARSGNEGASVIKSFKHVHGTTYVEYLKLRSQAYAAAFVVQHSPMPGYQE